ncbi:hypothetical protein LQ419_20345, partial [Gordonia paraffinivorans]|nr:hypothetical protein [Gordonia paraffinivorans]
SYCCSNKPVLHRLVEPGQYLSLTYTDRLIELGVIPSVGTVGDFSDNVLAESVDASYKAELIRQRRPWRTVEQVELAACEWVWWYTTNTAVTKRSTTSHQPSSRTPYTMPPLSASQPSRPSQPHRN